jgi:hypothetical protein
LIEDEEKKAEQARQLAFERNNACPICYDPIYVENGDPKEQFILKNCKCVLHKSCIERSVDEMIKKSIVEFPCPKDECRTTMCEYDLKQLLSDEMLDLYYKIALNRALDGCGDIQRCLTPNCAYAYIMEEGQNIFACAICTTNYCIDCKVKFHEGMSCSEWKLKQVNTGH